MKHHLNHHLATRLLGVAIATTALIAPAVASAQEAPAYASLGSDQQIQGTVAAINGTWNISVADANGYTDSIELHQGTIINPTGLTLEPGMNVTIDGYADGSNFDALEIDTPYQYDGPAPVAVYYGPGAWYPGYADGWGPSFSLFFDIGSNRFEQRSFAFGGQTRRPIAPPEGWQNQPHGFIGNANPARASHVSFVPQQRGETTQRYAQPQQRTTFAQPQQERSYAQPQQRTTFAQPQHERSCAQPQQRTTFAQPQQRTFAAPAARAARPAERSSGNDDHRRG